MRNEELTNLITEGTITEEEAGRIGYITSFKATIEELMIFAGIPETDLPNNLMLILQTGLDTNHVVKVRRIDEDGYFYFIDKNVNGTTASRLAKKHLSMINSAKSL